MLLLHLAPMCALYASAVALGRNCHNWQHQLARLASQLPAESGDGVGAKKWKGRSAPASLFIEEMESTKRGAQELKMMTDQQTKLREEIDVHRQWRRRSKHCSISGLIEKVNFGNNRLCYCTHRVAPKSAAVENWLPVLACMQIVDADAESPTILLLQP